MKGSLVVIDTDAYKVKMSISPGGQAAVDLFTLKGLDLVMKTSCRFASSAPITDETPWSSSSGSSPCSSVPSSPNNL